jgi:hypothetical protein
MPSPSALHAMALARKFALHTGVPDRERFARCNGVVAAWLVVRGAQDAGPSRAVATSSTRTRGEQARTIRSRVSPPPLSDGL